MKILKLSLILALALGFSAKANAANGKVVTDSLDSKILNTTVKYNVYLPAGFDKSGKQYPAIYLLHGLYGNYDNWEKNARMHEVANELMASGECREAVIIMPNAGGKDARNIHNGYFNVEGWNYEDFFFSELLPAVEKKYRCIGDKAHRAVMGLSMGGGGSTVYCQKHPDMFSSCYAMSPWLTEDAPAINPDDKGTYTRNAVHDHSAIVFLQNASDDVKNSLRTVRWFLDIGDDDFLLSQSFDFYEEMRRQFIPCELRVRNGIHNWEYWHNALRTSLPFASRNFKQ